MRFPLTLTRALTAFAALGAVPGAAHAFQMAECQFHERCDAEGACATVESTATLRRSTPIDAILEFRFGDVELGLYFAETQAGRAVLGGEHDAGAYMLSLDVSGANAELTSVGLDGKVDAVMRGECGDFHDV